MLAATARPCWIATGLMPGNGAAAPAGVSAAMSPMTPPRGGRGACSRARRCTRPPRSSGAPAPPPAGSGARPPPHSTVAGPLAATPRSRRPSPSIRSTRTPVRTSTPSSRSCARAPLGELRRERRRSRSARLDQHDAGLVGPNVVKVVAQDVAREIGDRARQLDAGRPAADHDEGQEPPPLVADRAVALGRLEGQQHPPPHLERVVEILEARGVSAPSRRGRSSWCARRPRRSDSRSRARRRRRARPARRQIEAGRRPPAARRRCGGGAAPSGSDTRCRCRQPRQRHLIEQRLEQVVVQAIDDRHLDGLVTERPGRGEAAEPGPDDHDARRPRLRLRGSHPKASAPSATDLGPRPVRNARV